MQLSKKILLTVLGISSYGSVMGMETEKIEADKNEAQPSVDASEKKYVFLLRKTPENQAKYLSIFAREDNNDTASALKVAQWLVFNRNNIAEARPWLEFVDEFVTKMEGCYTFGSPKKNKKLEAVIGVVKETAYGLRPGEDCSQLLVDRAVEELNKLEK